MTIRHALMAAAGALALAVAGCGSGDEDEARAPEGAASPVGNGELILASTTSTRDSGLFDELIPAFEKASGYRVKTIAVGSGEAIEMGRRGEADAVLAHSPAAEEELMDSGVAGDRRLVMHNDFVIIGPADDPAGARGDSSARALAAIAARRAPFVSRGDESGTHAKELSLWEDAGVEPGGSWYAETGQGMGATLAIAAEREAYTLTDRGTYLANERARDLPIMVEDEPPLFNFYHVIDIEPAAGPRVNAEAGDAFAEWIVSDAAQAIIGGFGEERFGEPLFDPDAGESVEAIRSGS